MEVSALETDPPTMKEAIEAESITSMKLGDEPAEGDLSILSKQSYVSHRGYVPPERVTGWINVIFIIMADLIGTGIVGLPYTYAKLGYGLGAAVLIIFGLLTFYAGLLLWRLHMTFPTALTYGLLGKNVSGQVIQWIAYVVVYAHFFLKMSSYLLTAAKSVQTMLWMKDICLYWATLGSLLVLFPLCQLRTLHQISFAGAVSVFTIGVVIMILLGQAYATWDQRGDIVIEAGPQGTGYEGFMSGFSAMTSLVFAYGGQGMYLETMSEMRNPADFPKALYIFSFLILSFYLWSSLSLYFRYGENSYGNILFNMNDGVLKTVASVFMFLHVCISFCLNSQLLARALHVRTCPKGVKSGGKKEAGQWFIITACTVLGAWIVANAIPFFSDLNGIISSLCVGPTTYGFPAMFYLLACRNANKHIPLYETLICYIMIIIAVFFVFVGTGTDFVKIIQDWGTFGEPFSCILLSQS